MRQRLTLERALLHDPRLVLLDEPFTGLDDASSSALVERLAELRASGRIVLVATHDLEVIDGLIDRAVMLRDGRLVGAAADRRLVARPLPRSGARADMPLLETIWLVMRKDLLIEFRSREIVYTTLFFAVSVMLVFSFSFVREGVAVEGAAPGILWVAIAFSGTLALGRAFERERQNETLRGLLMSPAERPALYLGKLAGIMLLLVAVEVVVVPLVAFMFQAPLFRYPALMAGLLLTGTLGFAAVGTLFAAMLVRTRSRDVLLPLLLYPITVPVIIAGVRGTAALLQTDADLPMARAWLSMLVFFDVVFVTLALWTFEAVMTE